MDTLYTMYSSTPLFTQAIIRFCALFLLALVSFSPLSVLAVNPPQPFTPSDNVLDPNCLPTDSNCYVSINNLSLTSATTTSLAVLANTTLGGDVSFSGATSTITDNVVTDVATATGTWGTWNDGTKWSAISPTDGFVRFVYQDNYQNNLNVVQCLDQDCGTKVSTIIATTTGNDIDFPQLSFGSDNLLRVTYVEYSSPNRLHFVQCLNESCSSNTNSSIVVSSLYEQSFDMGSDDFAKIIYSEYTPDNEGYRSLRLISCQNISCSSYSTSTIATTTNISGNGFYPDIVIDTNNIPHIAYHSFHYLAEGEIYMATCADTLCSSVTTNLVEAGTGWYGLSFVLGTDNAPRIVWQAMVSGVSALRYATCSDTTCSSSAISSLDTSNTSGGYSPAMVFDSNGLPRIAYGNSDGVKTIQCLNDTCSSKNLRLISTTAYGHTISTTLGQDGFLRILFRKDSGGTGIQMARLVSVDGRLAVTGQTLGALTKAIGDIFSSRVNTSILNVASEMVVGSTTNPFLTVFNSGHVSIGTTTSFTHKLTITGDIMSTGVYDSYNDANQYMRMRVMSSAVSAANHDWTNAGLLGAKNKLILMSNGEVSSNGTSSIEFRAGGYQTANRIMTAYKTGILIGTTFAGQATTSTNGLLVEGSVGIGTLTPTSSLTVQGISSKNPFLISSSTGSTLFSVLSNGKVGIGTSTPQYLFHVGNASTSGVVSRFENSTGYCDINPTTTSLTCTSDMRLKKNIVPLDASTTLSHLTQLNAVTYNWLTEDSASSTHAGFIAQEVQPLFPDLVSTDENGTLSVAYGGFVPYIIQAVKSLAGMVVNMREMFITKYLVAETLCVGNGEGKTCITKEKLDALLISTPTASAVAEEALTRQEQNVAPSEGESVATSTATTTPQLDIQETVEAVATTTQETVEPKEVVTPETPQEEATTTSAQ